MSRYLEIGTEITQRVRSGELAAGIELPAVRESARAQGTTPSTIGRAYRYLADGGVITLTDRRRARVASDGTIAAARLLEADRVFRLAGSDDPALQIVLDHVGPAVIPVGTRGSFHGLRALARGAADGAAIHLRHRDGTYNAPFARALLRHRQPHLLHLWKREQGLLVPPGNPQGVSTPGDLGALRVTKREVGAGTRVLLDQLLLAAGICPEDVAGPELHSHPEIALAVAAGIADVGLGGAARAAGRAAAARMRRGPSRCLSFTQLANDRRIVHHKDGSTTEGSATQRTPVAPCAARIARRAPAPGKLRERVGAGLPRLCGSYSCLATVPCHS